MIPHPQMPGLVMSADRTEALERNYWPSYNVPSFAGGAVLVGRCEGGRGRSSRRPCAPRRPAHTRFFKLEFLVGPLVGPGKCPCSSLRCPSPLPLVGAPNCCRGAFPISSSSFPPNRQTPEVYNRSGYPQMAAALRAGPQGAEYRDAVEGLSYQVWRAGEGRGGVRVERRFVLGSG